MEKTDVHVRPTRTQVERGLSWQPPHLYTALTTMRGHVLALQSVSFLWSMNDTVTVEVRQSTYRIYRDLCLLVSSDGTVAVEMPLIDAVGPWLRKNEGGDVMWQM